LGELAARHVARRAEPLDDLAVGAEDRHCARKRPADAAIGPYDAMLQLEHAAAGDRRTNRLHHALALLGWNVAVEPWRAGLQRVLHEIPPVEALHARPVGVHAIDDVGG